MDQHYFAEGSGKETRRHFIEVVARAIMRGTGCGQDMAISEVKRLLSGKPQTKVRLVA